MDERKKIVLSMLKRGSSYQTIGDFLGISRQRVHQLVIRYSDNKKNTLQIDESKLLTLKQTVTFDESSISPDIRRYSRLKELIRARDNFTCQICGKIWKPGTRRFDIHHLDQEKENIPYSKEKYLWDKSNTDRMVTLCRKCHQNLEHIKSPRLGKLPLK